jgi:hypothetical protein
MYIAGALLIFEATSWIALIVLLVRAISLAMAVQKKVPRGTTEDYHKLTWSAFWTLIPMICIATSWASRVLTQNDMKYIPITLLFAYGLFIQYRVYRGWLKCYKISADLDRIRRNNGGF